jgi:hypothetical protein
MFLELRIHPQLLEPYRRRGAQLNLAHDAVEVCLQTHHLDSPNHQEPISDPGDYVIEGMVSYYAFGQPWLTRLFASRAITLAFKPDRSHKPQA